MDLLAIRRAPARPSPLAAPDIALEAVVQWGTHSVLHVAHLAPPRSFLVGEASAEQPVDFALDPQTLGETRIPLAIADEQGLLIVVPQGAQADLVIDGCAIAEHELAAQGKVHAHPTYAGARTFVLPANAYARVLLGELCFSFQLTAHDTEPLAPRTQLDWKRERWTFASLGVHIAALALFALLPPASPVLALDQIKVDSRWVEFAREALEKEKPPMWDDPGPEGGSEEGARREGDEGAAGDPKAPAQPKRAAARGRASTPAMPSAPEPIDAANAGILGILRSSQLAVAHSFTAERAEGNAIQDYLGGLLGDQLGNSRGVFGAGMIGTGRGGGGHGVGTIGIGNLGTIGTGLGHGEGTGYGRGTGRLGGRIERVPPPVTTGRPDIRGSLSKETIRRVIHRHLPEIRSCYEQRLISRPDLQGRIAVRFIISTSGVVQIAAAASSDLGDAITEQCIVSAVRRWTFPMPPGGGVVSVTYPFMLQQAGN